MTEDLKQQLAERGQPVGTWLSIGHPTVAEVSAMQGFDFTLLDTEHTTMSLETVEEMARGVDAADTETEMVVRVPWNDSVRLKRLLDIGIAGVMVPMVESAAEAHELVESVRYPPDGKRGIASGRASDYGMNFTEYVKDVNGTIATIVQIETETGLGNVGDIASVDGIDALFVGPADLSRSLDVFGEWDSDTLRDAMRTVIQVGHEADIPVGTLTTSLDDVALRLDQGFDFLIVGKDTALLIDKQQEALERYEAALRQEQ
jgi:2-keto-3-deoxy-L-rhamnonate aldolase RhmA